MGNAWFRLMPEYALCKATKDYVGLVLQATSVVDEISLICAAATSQASRILSFRWWLLHPGIDEGWGMETLAKATRDLSSLT